MTPLITFMAFDVTPTFHVPADYTHVRDGIERKTTTKTLCGQPVTYIHFIDTRTRSGKYVTKTIEREERGAWLRRDHALTIGRLCGTCERIEADR